MKSLIVRTALLAGATAFLAAAANADTISYPSGSCDSMGCEGSGLELTVEAGSAADTWDVSLTIDTTNYTGSLPGISQVGFGAIEGWSSVSFVADPGGLWGTPVASSLNNVPCASSQNNQHKVCVAGYVDVVTTPGDYTWDFLVTGGTMMDTDSWHIGAQYQNAEGTSNGHIISTMTNPIPEPSAALVFAVGFGVISTAVRRRSA
jgi:hypothetical protein